MAPALIVNFALDVVKILCDNRPKALLPLLCMAFSAVLAIFYAGLSEETPERAFMQGCSIMGISMFFYSVGGYCFIRDRITKRLRRREDYSDKD